MFVPVCSAGAEQSFSALKRLRSTMSNASVCHVHRVALEGAGSVPTKAATKPTPVFSSEKMNVLHTGHFEFPPHFYFGQ